jgi:hypothetical protein
VAEDNSGWSDVFSFTTFAAGKELNFAVVADMAYDGNSDYTISSITALVDQGRCLNEEIMFTY